MRYVVTFVCAKGNGRLVFVFGQYRVIELFFHSTRQDTLVVYFFRPRTLKYF
jgi:hypothetical protein